MTEENDDENLPRLWPRYSPWRDHDERTRGVLPGMHRRAVAGQLDMEGEAMKAYPCLLCLPGGIQARVRIIHVVETNDKGESVLTQLVSTPPVYELRDGTTVDADVTIPDDLPSWRWQGSFLSNGGIAIFTGTYGLAETFAIARRHDADQRVVTTAETGPQQLVMDLV